MNDRDENGRFIVGNQAGKIKDKARIKLAHEDRKFVIAMVRKYSFMTLTDLKNYAANATDLTYIEAFFIQCCVASLNEGNINFLRLLFNYLGVVEIKAMAIQEMNKINDENDEEIKDLNLSKSEKIDLLDKYREIIEEHD